MAHVEQQERPDGRLSSSTGDETVIAPRPIISGHKDSSSDQLRAEARRGVALVEGSTPRLSNETRDLLRNRLRLAAIMFFVGFLAFLIRWAFYWSEWGKAEHMPMFYTHAVITVVLGAFAVRLCRHCAYSLTKLRVAELVIFGCPSVYFLMHALDLNSYLVGLPAGETRIETIVTPWLFLIFTYALFIPNTWQRAAAVLGAIRAIPIGVLVYFETAEKYRQILAHENYSGFISAQVLIILISLLTGIVGVYTIGTLRREAFAAKQLGQYRLKKLLGSGGMGEVYLAEHQMMKRPCAVKLIRPEKAGDPRMLARFEREVRATAKLSHWNSIDIYDYGRTADGTFYYVMEYLAGTQHRRDGGELRRHPRGASRLPAWTRFAPRWPRPTASAWCIATSSRPISFAPIAVACSTLSSCSTSALPNRLWRPPQTPNSPWPAPSPVRRYSCRPSKPAATTASTPAATSTRLAR